MTAAANQRVQHARHSTRNRPGATEGDPPLASLTHGCERAAFDEWERLWKSVLRKNEGKIAEAQSAMVPD